MNQVLETCNGSILRRDKVTTVYWQRLGHTNEIQTEWLGRSPKTVTPLNDDTLQSPETAPHGIRLRLVP